MNIKAHWCPMQCFILSIHLLLLQPLCHIVEPMCPHQSVDSPTPALDIHSLWRATVWMEELQSSEKIQTTVQKRRLTVEMQPNKPSQSPSASRCGAAWVNDGRAAAVIRFPACRMLDALSLRWPEASLCSSSLSFFFTRFRLLSRFPFVSPMHLCHTWKLPCSCTLATFFFFLCILQRDVMWQNVSQKFRTSSGFGGSTRRQFRFSF